jgi:hypothetical protein
MCSAFCFTFVSSKEERFLVKTRVLSASVLPGAHMIHRMVSFRPFRTIEWSVENGFLVF